MTMSFQVNYVLFCDYVAQERSGKQIYGGVYSDEIVYASPPMAWIGHLVISLKAHKPAFRVKIHVVRPDKQKLIDLRGEFKPTSTASEAQSLPTVNINIPFYGLRFTGPGIYTIDIYEDEHEHVLSKNFLVTVGVAKPPLLGSFDAKITANAEI